MVNAGIYAIIAEQTAVAIAVGVLGFVAPSGEWGWSKAEVAGRVQRSGEHGRWVLHHRNVAKRTA